MTHDKFLEHCSTTKYDWNLFDEHNACAKQALGRIALFERVQHDGSSTRSARVRCRLSPFHPSGSGRLLESSLIHKPCGCEHDADAKTFVTRGNDRQWMCKYQHRNDLARRMNSMGCHTVVRRCRWLPLIASFPLLAVRGDWRLSAARHFRNKLLNAKHSPNTFVMVLSSLHLRQNNSN